MRELTDRELDAVTGGGFRPIAVAMLTAASPGLLGRGARWPLPTGLAAPPRIEASAPSTRHDGPLGARSRGPWTTSGWPALGRLGAVFRFPG
jgi:hypothetical protein